MASDENIVVRVDAVAKKFARSLKRSFVYGARDIGRMLLGRTSDDTLRASEFWAVRDVSFTLRRGRSIGIVGQNGSGKTTLLRMVCGILRPSLGTVTVHGRIAPMLALGAGFKPVLSGRQNVFLNLSLLGVAERDIRARYDSIVDFAELHEAIDAPLGTYSSGMQARLGFACAVHTEPSILVVDEVLSVGDARFRVKCRNKINELRRSGTSLLLVSHSAALIETLSDECLYLHSGRAVMLGLPTAVMRAYEAATMQEAHDRTNTKLQELTQQSRRESAELRVLQVAFGGADSRQDADGDEEGGADAGPCWTAGRDAEITVQFGVPQPLDEVSLNVMVFDLAQPGTDAILFLTSSRDIGWLRFTGKSASVRLRLPQLGLRAGTYRVKLSISRTKLHDILAVVDDLRIVVRSDERSTASLYHQNRAWEATGAVCSALPDQAGADAEQGPLLADWSPGRFNCDLQIAPSWMRRAEVAAGLLAGACADGQRRWSLADVGCGDRKLRTALTTRTLPIDYVGFDLHPQSPDITRFDAAADSLPRPFDIAVMLGVTEYLPDLPSALRRLSDRADQVLLSHVVAERSDYSPTQLDELGWINHLTTTAFEALLADVGLHPIDRVWIDDDRVLLVLCRRTSTAPPNSSA